VEENGAWWIFWVPARYLNSWLLAHYWSLINCFRTCLEQLLSFRVNLQEKALEVEYAQNLKPNSWRLYSWLHHHQLCDSGQCLNTNLIGSQLI
jgi:hypothetical protein